MDMVEPRDSHSSPMRSLVFGAVLGGLVAQRQQANNYQRALLAQQALEEQVASAQIAYMKDVEANRQREKTQEVWREEFKHQGMSPMEAQLQIQTEIELSELMAQGLPKRPDLEIEIAKIINLGFPYHICLFQFSFQVI